MYNFYDINSLKPEVPATCIAHKKDESLHMTKLTYSVEPLGYRIQGTERTIWEIFGPHKRHIFPAKWAWNHGFWAGPLYKYQILTIKHNKKSLRRIRRRFWWTGHDWAYYLPFISNTVSFCDWVTIWSKNNPILIKNCFILKKWKKALSRNTKT